MEELIPNELIHSKIYIIRGKKVMLDKDLSDLYQVETRTLNQAVKRNFKRFPDDFMFQLDIDEFQNLISQNVTSSWGGIRKNPFAFTENGIAMLSGILSSDRAIAVNIQIMRAFTKLRELMVTHRELLAKIEKLEQKYDNNFKIVWEVIDQLLVPPEENKRQIGFIRTDD